MKKKILGALLSIAMIGTLFTGCGQQQGEVEKEASKKESADKGESGFEPVAKEDLKVGVIHIGYSYAHDLGIVEMQKELGLEDNQIIRKNNIPDADPTKTEQAMRECIEEGCQVIYATSFNYMDTCEALAEEYPDVIFSHGTGYKSNDTNFNNYFGRISVSYTHLTLPTNSRV